MSPSKSIRRRRRADHARMRRKARILYPHDPKARLAEYLANCSCWMCGNPRRRFKTDRLTMQERRAEDACASSLPEPGDDAV